ncbi:hypothetical protein [Chlorogloeopsis sp. ULAP02]|uniref:hypothetical protein n=1 Tax=Chlorogloeopsis sp. ULAP02 TaxID=3107926 RepID=UPI003136AB4C
MNFLQTILGGGQVPDNDYHDFIRRYEQGLPYEGYSDEEVLSRYQQVSQELPDHIYQESAQEAFNRMSPQERMQLGQYLREQTRQQNIDFIDQDQDGVDDRLQDSNYLARATGRLHQQQPDLLGSMSGGNAFNPLLKGAMAGIAALAVKKLMEGGRSQGQYGNIRPASEDPYGDPADYGQYGNIRPASEDPYGDPADYGQYGNISPASEDPYGDPADSQRRW